MMLMKVVLSVFDVRNTHETRTQDLRLCYGEDKNAEVSFWKFVDCCSRSCGRSTPARRSGEKSFQGPHGQALRPAWDGFAVAQELLFTCCVPERSHARRKTHLSASCVAPSPAGRWDSVLAQAAQSQQYRQDFFSRRSPPVWTTALAWASLEKARGSSSTSFWGTRNTSLFENNRHDFGFMELFYRNMTYLVLDKKNETSEVAKLF